MGIVEKIVTLDVTEYVLLHILTSSVCSVNIDSGNLDNIKNKIVHCSLN